MAVKQDGLDSDDASKMILSTAANSATSIHLVATKPRKADDAYELLKHMIVTLRIPPGAPLDERKLMATLKIGRTPIREAAQRLAMEQLVVAVPRRGYFVSELSLSDLNEMIIARDIIEPQVARYATRYITDEMIRTLRQLIDETVAQIAQNDLEVSVIHDQEFHQAIADACRNRYLAAMANQINTSLLRYWYISFTMVGDLITALTRHHHILDLMEARDEDAVEEAMHAHIDGFRKRIKRAVGNGMAFPAHK